VAEKVGGRAREWARITASGYPALSSTLLPINTAA